MATKTKKTKSHELTPPQDIRENTKARRAWLAAELEKVNATPGLEGKIVGQGSYQCVSVWKITEVEGRLRHRGNCQVCGALQVVGESGKYEGRLVLHGYTRPGYGFVINNCPGEAEAPLQTTDAITVELLHQSRNTHTELEAERDEAEALERKTLMEIDSREYKLGLGGRPSLPEAVSWRKKQPTAEDIQAARDAQTAWDQAHPTRAAHFHAERKLAKARNAAWQMKQQVEHFERLVALKLPGTPLVPEVVT